jgi:hypothetical protein
VLLSELFRYVCFSLTLLVVFHVPQRFASATSLIKLWFDPFPSEALTFITTPIHTITQFRLDIFKTAISSWLLTDPRTRVIVIADTRFNLTSLTSCLHVYFAKNRILILCPFDVDSDGVPFARSFLTTGATFTRTRYCCFIRMDVVVDPFWYDRMLVLLDHFGNKDIILAGQHLRLALSRPTLPSATFYSEFAKSVEPRPCADQLGSDYFVWPAGDPPFALAGIPDFKLGAFLDRWIMAAAGDKTRAVTVKRNVPVYRLDSGECIGERARAYHNAHVVEARKHALAEHRKMMFSFDGVAMEGLVPMPIGTSIYAPLFGAPIECGSPDDTPIVHLTVSGSRPAKNKSGTSNRV